MLAAAPEPNSGLGLIQVVLTSIIGKPEVEVSEPLKTHVFEVLQAASVVAANPTAINSRTPSEALELALRMRGRQDLWQKFSEIHSFNGIRADVAEQLLMSLRSYAA
ncbi:hypothetical protein V0R37_04040 [Pollutimonas sp. H1-120]|uniref:hypothetical protein n=1 Tax=Pollutimonas sp. H1-120 TaxID=3148824 RepID=UPI003B517512